MLLFLNPYHFLKEQQVWNNNVDLNEIYKQDDNYKKKMVLSSSKSYRINVLIFHDVSSITLSLISSLDENIVHSNSSTVRNKKTNAKIKWTIINLIASNKVLRSKILLSP